MSRFFAFLSKMTDNVPQFVVFLQRLGLLRRRSTWVEILVLGALLSFGVAAWPTAQCALGACGPRELWCEKDCSKTCAGATRFGVVLSCYKLGLGCYEAWMPESVPVRCSDPNTCAITEVLGTPNRLSGGRWNSGKCNAGKGCILEAHWRPVSCCVLGEEEPPCTSSYGPPTITMSTDPAHPLVFGQDPYQEGVTVNIQIRGGADLSCGRGYATLTTATITRVSLSAASRDWIKDILAQTYPDAKVQGSYPFTPNYTITPALPTTSAVLSYHFDPLDPGNYEFSVTIAQSDGKTTTSNLIIPVALLDATIIGGPQMP